MYIRDIEFEQGVSCFLFGPRGTGKTFWLRHVFPEGAYIDLLEAKTFNTLSADPQRIDRWLPGSNSVPVIIDEIQKLPILLDEVHRLIENGQHWFILTGSSARKLRRSGVNLLGGRALTKHLHTLTASELGPDFDLGMALSYGLLPTIYDQKKKVPPEAYLQSYIQTYLKEEVYQEGLTRNLGAFSRFLEAASFSQAQLLNISAVARECQIKRKLAESYFQILEDLLLAIRVLPFERRARRRITLHSKFFLFDVGVFRAVRPCGPLDSSKEIDGPALETLVLQHLRPVMAKRLAPDSIYYWRTASGMEVDFVVYHGNVFTAIEVKRKRSIDSRDLTGLRAFHDEYPQARRVLIYGGDRLERIGDILAVPFTEALFSMEKLINGTLGTR